MNIPSHFRIANGSDAKLQVPSASDLQYVYGGGISVPLPPPSLVGNPSPERRDHDLSYRTVVLGRDHILG